MVRHTATSLSIGTILLANLVDMHWTIDPEAQGFGSEAKAPVDAVKAKAPTGRAINDLKPLVKHINKNNESLKLAKDIEEEKPP